VDGRVADNDLPTEVQRLITDAIASMDHVEVLRRLQPRGDTPMAVDALAHDTHIAMPLLARVLVELEAARLIAVSDGQVRYTASSRDDAAVLSLIDMYNTRPVTLVRAVYARLSPVKTFADAFRLRKDS
jgi:hypothetical protein